jgi:hypothetical protein
MSPLLFLSRNQLANIAYQLEKNRRLIGPIQYLKVKNQSAKNNNDGNTVLLMMN